MEEASFNISSVEETIKQFFIFKGTPPPSAMKKKNRVTVVTSVLSFAGQNFPLYCEGYLKIFCGV
jgi:hypothetical protein